MRPGNLGVVATGLAAILIHASSAKAEGQAEPPAGFIALFSGKDLSGWHGMPHFDPRQLAAMGEDERSRKRAEWTEDARKHWRVEDGELLNDGQGAYLTSDKEYGDIELRIEFKIAPKGDSGIYVRGTPQIQIWDTTEAAGYGKLGADKGSGGLWNNSPGAPGKDPLVLADRPIGEWNRFRILQVGARTTVYLNDRLVVDNAPMENFWDRSQPLFGRGPIQLQTHGGEVRWRNIFLREIPTDEANKILSGGDKGFTALFDGKGLDGWAGPVENYEVADGAIRCKSGKGGTIYYDKEFANFVARVEFRLPPGGNNGLAIRHPGQGDPSVVAMCELQILDDTAPQYARLDPRQYCGSVYGMVPARRGYLRPVGAWNFEEVTVKGSKIKVELNGTVIVDADVSKVTEFMDGKSHPGKDRTSGFFGFAGHNDPVEFRHVAIKALD
jgi:hypothetical protein